MRVLVTGGRWYSDMARVFDVLSAAHALEPVSSLIHGAATGADTFADTWATSCGVNVERYPALWDVHGRKAGMVRNRLMLTDGQPDLVVAFRGGRGTAGMVDIAEKAGVRVVKIDFDR